MVDYIEQHKDEFGVEPICTMLGFASSTYYAAKSRVPSARAMRDAVLMPLLLALWIDNYRVYGARKLWKAARRHGHNVGRDQVARLMRQLGILGVPREGGHREVRRHGSGYGSAPTGVVSSTAAPNGGAWCCANGRSERSRPWPGGGSRTLRSGGRARP